MLVLTRRLGEQIVIANNIRITVVGVGPGRVKIGIEAPDNVRIDRQEIHVKIVREQSEQTDVLAAVGRPVPSEDVSPTIVANGDTATTLHNRIVDKLPAVTSSVAAIASNGATNPRLPRKPR